MVNNPDAVATTLKETNVILKEIEEKFGWQDDKQKAYTALRAVLQTLRDRLTVEEAADFAAQLPVLLKGVWWDKWKPEAGQQKWNREEFYIILAAETASLTQMTAAEVFTGVMDVLSRHVSGGEILDAAGMLPEKLANDLFT